MKMGAATVLGIATDEQKARESHKGESCLPKLQKAQTTSFHPMDSTHHPQDFETKLLRLNQILDCPLPTTKLRYIVTASCHTALQTLHAKKWLNKWTDYVKTSNRVPTKDKLHKGCGNRKKYQRQSYRPQ